MKQKGLVVPKQGRPFVTEINGLKDMQAVVGGLIQPVNCEKFDIYLNEEGLLRNLKMNIGITKMIHSMQSNSLLQGRTAHELMHELDNAEANGKLISRLVDAVAEPYVGDALIMGKIDENGETTSITRSALSGWFTEWLGDPTCVVCDEDEPCFDAKVIYNNNARWGQFCSTCYAMLEIVLREKLAELHKTVTENPPPSPEATTNEMADNFGAFVEALFNMPALGVGNGQMLLDKNELEKLEV